MYYSDDALEELKADYQTVDGKLDHLVQKYFLLDLKNTRAKEIAAQGFPRRLKIMVRCIDNVFGMIPPDRVELPSRDELSDATINKRARITFPIKFEICPQNVRLQFGGPWSLLKVEAVET
jgi:hypothetical protein